MDISKLYKEYNDNFLQDLIADIRKNGASNPEVLEALAHIKLAHPDEFERYEPTLNSAMGLFFKNRNVNSILSLFSDEFSSKIREEFGFSATPVQANIISGIEDNQVYSFSGPTSMGKSHAIRHLVRECARDVVIVLPSRSLISEYCDELKSKLPYGCIVLQFVEQINTALSNKRIYVITPERSNPLFSLPPSSVGLFVFDEAQLSDNPTRGYKFDALVRRASNYFRGARLIFAHPFIKNPDAQITKNRLTNYKYQSFCCRYGTVGKVFASYDSKLGYFSYFSPYQEKFVQFKISEDLFREALCSPRGAILIYTSKAKIESITFIKKLRKYFKLLPHIEAIEATEIINEIRSYIGDIGETLSSSLVKYMRRGIVYHHGSMPLKVRGLVEKFVNAGFAKVCVATSTLTQGVNMPFSLVWIDECRFFGSKDDGDNFKNLSLKNLIGRAGRSSSSNVFDVGTVVINSGSLSTFKRIFQGDVVLSDKSRLDTSVPGDPDYEYTYAINNDDLNYEYDMPNSQVVKFHQVDSHQIIQSLIGLLTNGSESVPIADYRTMSDDSRDLLKSCFVGIFELHVSRKAAPGESAVIKAMVNVALNYLSSGSFAFVVGQQLSYWESRKYLPKAIPLPNSKLKKPVPLFIEGEPLNFDAVVCNTYDFLDKVYRLYFLPLLIPAITEYYKENNDASAMALLNYLRYGSTDAKVIWLHKYGYTIEDMKWLLECVDDVDGARIIFNNKALFLSREQKESILPYCPWILDISSFDG